MNRDKEISSKELQACARKASTRAVARAQARKIPYPRKIVQRNADGTRTIIETLPKAFVKPPAKRYRVA